MIETLNHMCLTLTDPDETAALGTLEGYFEAIVPMTIIAVSAAPLEDDAGATVDIDDDGTNVISGVDASDANVPGTWLSKHVGGTNAPVSIAKGSLVSFDLNNAAAGNAFFIHVWYLAGVGMGT